VSLEPELPLEFIVPGTALSQQGSAGSIAAWKQAIRNAEKQALPDGGAVGGVKSRTMKIVSDPMKPPGIPPTIQLYFITL
jgi:hypothetical protein